MGVWKPTGNPGVDGCLETSGNPGVDGCLETPGNPGVDGCLETPESMGVWKPPFLETPESMGVWKPPPPGNPGVDGCLETPESMGVWKPPKTPMPWATSRRWIATRMAGGDHNRSDEPHHAGCSRFQRQRHRDHLSRWNDVAYGTYNSFAEPASVTDQLSRTTTFTYDGDGNLTVEENALDDVTTYTYSGTQPACLPRDGPCAGRRRELHAGQLPVRFKRPANDDDQCRRRHHCQTI